MSASSAEASSFGVLLTAFRHRRHLTQAHLAQRIGVHRHAVGRWEQGDVLPGSKGLVLELAKHLHLDDQETRQLLEASLIALAPYWGVPLLRNPYFTGREEVLEALHRQLGVQQGEARTHAVALQGLGGVGKTQIALEYAYRHALDYSAVFWSGAETEEQIVSSLVQTAEALQLPERVAQDQQRVAAAVQHWLATHRHWLLIWDNVEDLELLDRLLPSARQGAILLTTRCQTLGTRAVALDLEPMAPEEGVWFLLRRANVLAETAPLADLRQFARQQPAQYQAAVEVVTEMGGLPLALDQAGAYLEATRCGLPAYLELFRTQRAALLQERGEGVREHSASVWTTFTLALSATTRRHPAVGELLRVCALLQAEAIPEELFRQGAACLGGALEAAGRDALAWNRVVASACAYSLLQRHPEAQTLSLHRLVQAVLEGMMTEAEQAAWSQRVIGALEALFPDVWLRSESAAWTQGERLLPHALRCLQRAGAEDAPLVLAACAYKVAQYLRARARFAEAEPLYQRAEQIQEQLLGPDHLDVACSLNALGGLYTDQGQFGQAEPLYQRALAIREAVVGPAHPLVARSLNNLAVLYWAQGWYGEAEGLYQRALGILEQTPGPDAALHTILHTNLAHLCRAQGREGEAEARYQRAVALWGQQLRLGSSSLAEPLQGLADLYREQGREAEAEALYQRALDIREQVWGPDHPDVAYSLTGLAGLCRVQGRAGEAEALYRRAVALWEQHWGPDHPCVAGMLTGLAGLCREQGREAEAEALYQRALDIREQALGRAHPDVAETLQELALLRQKQGRLREACALAERARSIRAQTLGEAHLKTLATQALYAQLLQKPPADKEQAHAERDAAHRTDPDRERGQAEKTKLARSTALAPATCRGDPVRAFFAACCEVHPLAWCRIRELWDAYERWTAAEQGCVPLPRRAFAAQLKALGCRVDRTSTARIWRGIRLVKPSS